ncbi:MAG: hypothetical protein WC744_01885 [Patescibacteria group bacterium]|jgi:hypothetical protein
MQIINNKYIKIFLVFTVAYLISSFSIENLFLAKSPKINPYFGQNMMAKATGLLNKTKNLVAFRINLPNFSNTGGTINNNQPSALTNQESALTLTKKIDNALQTPLSKISQGVYAGERDGIRVYEIRTGEIDYLEYTFTVNGKEIKIKVPKDQSPPSQQTMEALYK